MNHDTPRRRDSLSRRRFLRGVGACMALPALESFLPGGAQQAMAVTPDSFAGSAAATRLATTATGAPLRMAFFYIPNGVHQENWWPTGEGKDFQLGATMKPLEKVKDHLQVFGGLDQVNATAGPDGAGDHARANGTFLTGVRVKKTAGADIRAGVSIDQVAAMQLGQLTRFPSLELTCVAERRSGNCDSGYSCAYQHNLAWRSPTVPVAPEANPRLVFERLFGEGKPGERRAHLKARQDEDRSLLDFVLDDAADLQRGLGSRDKQKLDEYLTSVRQIEKRIHEAERFGDAPDPAVDTPVGIPKAYAEHIQLMFDMLLLAFQTDSTRIATFLIANDGANRAFPEIGIPEGHHFLSHHQGKQDMLAKIAKIDLFFMTQYGNFIEKMQQTQDVDGNSLLHNSMLVYGGGIADGNRHSHVNLPVLLAGSAGGTFTPGRFVRQNSQPMSNLFLSMADSMGVKGLNRFGDSTARLTDV
jgi:hypothetical protein